MKPIFRILPLIYFIGLSLFWAAENYMSLGVINYVAIVAAVALFVQLIVKHKVAGLVTGIVMGLFCIYMLLAMLSDLAKTKDITSGTLRFMAFGGGLFGAGLIMAIAFTLYFAKMPRPIRPA